MPEDEVGAKEAARIIASRSGWPISVRNVRDAIERGTLAAVSREVEGQPRPMWFIQREEVIRYAELRRIRTRKGPLTEREKLTQGKRGTKTGPYDTDPWARRRPRDK